MFLEGVYDGWHLRETEDTIDGKMVHILAASKGSSLSFEELAEMVNAAYSDPENRSLPVGWVMLADLAIQRGETSRDRVFPALLRHLAAISEKTHGARPSEVSPIDTILSAKSPQ
jgi:hypothetical protein